MNIVLENIVLKNVVLNKGSNKTLLKLRDIPKIITEDILLIFRLMAKEFIWVLIVLQIRQAKFISKNLKN